MQDWTDNAPQELKDVITDAMANGIHEDFASYYDFLRACVDIYEQINLDTNDVPTTTELKVGMRVKFIQDIELYPHAIVKANETGTITSIQPDGRFNFLLVKLDTYHEGLEEWSNELQMSDCRDYEDTYPSLYLNTIPI